MLEDLWESIFKRLMKVSLKMNHVSETWLESSDENSFPWAALVHVSPERHKRDVVDGRLNSSNVVTRNSDRAANCSARWMEWQLRDKLTCLYRSRTMDVRGINEYILHGGKRCTLPHCVSVYKEKFIEDRWPGLVYIQRFQPSLVKELLVQQVCRFIDTFFMEWTSFHQLYVSYCLIIV